MGQPLQENPPKRPILPEEPPERQPPIPYNSQPPPRTRIRKVPSSGMADPSAQNQGRKRKQAPGNKSQHGKKRQGSTDTETAVIDPTQPSHLTPVPSSYLDHQTSSPPNQPPSWTYASPHGQPVSSYQSFSSHQPIPGNAPFRGEFADTASLRGEDKGKQREQSVSPSSGGQHAHPAIVGQSFSPPHSAPASSHHESSYDRSAAMGGPPVPEEEASRKGKNEGGGGPSTGSGGVTEPGPVSGETQPGHASPEKYRRIPIKDLLNPPPQ
jgi:hypothetical protein